MKIINSINIRYILSIKPQPGVDTVCKILAQVYVKFLMKKIYENQYISSEKNNIDFRYKRS